MSEQMQDRLAELRREYELGQRRLQEVMGQEVALRETLLRISGAIQVLEELSGAPADGPAPDPQTTTGPAPEALRTGAPRADGAPVEPPAPGTVLTVG
ncbi:MULTISPECIES: hypothetical protein [unclassified Streptomyces]|uniref:hypothetical protein n=1 Tax=unclassified Streptomyces TaxID=2593676 RepID=UPI00225AEEA6|nr:MULTISPECIES: hypothetical protein [unclassified Streptomyces]MCX5328340.1 hypothetical protein [Streptomyces sp. NBC_00140]MCX5357756.1 hypothetical protein [Streptomyces sp. NBC_00124]